MSTTSLSSRQEKIQAYIRATILSAQKKNYDYCNNNSFKATLGAKNIELAGNNIFVFKEGTSNTTVIDDEYLSFSNNSQSSNINSGLASSLDVTTSSSLSLTSQTYLAAVHNLSNAEFLSGNLSTVSASFDSDLTTLLGTTWGSASTQRQDVVNKINTLSSSFSSIVSAINTYPSNPEIQGLKASLVSTITNIITNGQTYANTASSANSDSEKKRKQAMAIGMKDLATTLISSINGINNKTGIDINSLTSTNTTLTNTINTNSQSSGLSGISAWGDPHFSFQNKKFDFQGQADHIYNILSDSNLEFNSQFGHYNDNAKVMVNNVITVDNGKEDGIKDSVSLDKAGIAKINDTDMVLDQTYNLCDGGTAIFKLVNNLKTLTVTTGEGYSITQTVQTGSGGYIDITDVRTTKNVNLDGVDPTGIIGNLINNVNTYDSYLDFDQNGRYTRLSNDYVRFEDENIFARDFDLERTSLEAQEASIKRSLNDNLSSLFSTLG